MTFPPSTSCWIHWDVFVSSYICCHQLGESLWSAYSWRTVMEVVPGGLWLGQKIPCWTSHFSGCYDGRTDESNLGRFLLAYGGRIWSIIVGKVWAALAVGEGHEAAGPVSAIRRQRVMRAGALLSFVLLVEIIQRFNNLRISHNVFQPRLLLSRPPSTLGLFPPPLKTLSCCKCPGLSPF